jgi:hypothetical protein
VDQHKKERPYGYWDNCFTTEGITYKLHNLETLHNIANLPTTEAPFLKLKPSGLVSSDPKYIDKVLIILKKSNIKKLNPYLSMMGDICRWLNYNPQVKSHILCCEELTDDTVLSKRLTSFLCVSLDSEKLKHMITELTPDKCNDKVINDLFEAMKSKNYDKSIEIINNFKSEKEKLRNQWICKRTDKRTNYQQCELCKNSESFRRNLKMRAEKNGVNWLSQPCLFECGYDDNNSPISFADSIVNNFWK